MTETIYRYESTCQAKHSIKAPLCGKPAIATSSSVGLICKDHSAQLREIARSIGDPDFFKVRMLPRRGAGKKVRSAKTKKFKGSA